MANGAKPNSREKNVPCVLSSCLDVWSLAWVPMSPSSANICPDPSVRAGHCDVTNWTQFVWSRVLFPGHIHHLSLTQSIHNIAHCYPTQLLATDMCLFVRIEFNSINRLALCVHSLSSSYKKKYSQPSTVRKFNRVWVILLLLLSVRDNTVAMLVSLADNPILFSASINTDYRCPIPRLGLTSSLQTDNLILHVHT